METGETADKEETGRKLLGTVSKFVETDICPLQHDKYVKEGKWESHILYCGCGCSFCEEARLRRDNPEKAS